MGKEDFPRLLREWREANGLSQAALAARIGIKGTQIYSYEKGIKTPSVETREKLIRETGIDAADIPCGRCRHEVEDRPLTEEEQRFATEHYGCVLHYIRSRKLNFEDYYEVLVFAYLRAVQIWFEREAARKYSFTTIAYRKMAYGVMGERRARRLRPITVSIDDVIPNTDGMTYGETLCDPRDCVRT